MLIGFDQAVGFLAVAVVITLAPGPDNVMVVSLGAARGWRAGVAFGLGCACGCLSHTLLAALGVGLLIAASPWAFGALKLCGGGYLVWLGGRVLVASWRADPDRGRDGGGTEPLGLLFRRGVLANAVNPKVMLFFLAFLPQFVVASQGMPGLQMAQLGLLFAFQAALTFGALGAGAGWIRAWFIPETFVGASPGRWLDRAAGVIFVALGVKLILLP